MTIMNQEWMRNVALTYFEITGCKEGRDSELDEKRKGESMNQTVVSGG
jgi:hypothetical protein